MISSPSQVIRCAAPTGIGVLYGKFDLLQMTDPFMLGGGNNAVLIYAVIFY